MSNRILKYGILLIATVLFVAIFAGVASAVEEIDSDDWNSMSAPTEGEYHISNGNYPIEPKNLGGNWLGLTGDLTLDFTGYTLGFSGVTTTTGQIGALFGDVDVQGHTLKIIGLNISAVTVSSPGGNNVGGIIGMASGTGGGDLYLINCHAANCSINGQNWVGGLIGHAQRKKEGVVTAHLEECSAEHCDVISEKSSAGGLMGDGDTSIFTNSNVTNSTLLAKGEGAKDPWVGCAGGIIGSSGTSTINGCNVENCSVHAIKNGAGGLAGYVGSVLDIESSSVKNCIIVSGTNAAGGLFGVYYGYNEKDTINSCTVMNCTIAGTTKYIGGLFGGAYNVDGSGNSVEYSAVTGSTDPSSQVGLEYGRLDKGSIICTAEPAKNFLRNSTYPGTSITLYNKDGKSLEFTDANLWRDVFVTTGKKSGKAEETSVTYLGRYGAEDGYGVVNTAGEYYIRITNSTGTYPMSASMWEVLGDEGTPENGSVWVEKVNGIYVLTLENFKASSNANLPIIDASVPHLKIVLNGVSNLQAQVSKAGAINVTSNLIIAPQNAKGDELIVKNTANEDVSAIYANNTLEITSAKVTAIVQENDEGSGVFGLYSAFGDITISDSALVSVQANNKGSAFSIYADRGGVQISGSGTVVDVDALSEEMYGYAIFGDKFLKVTGCKMIEATGSTSSFAVSTSETTRNFAALKSTHKFSNTSILPKSTISYQDFTRNWHDLSPYISNYSSLLIEKSPQVTSSSKSSSNGGATIILTETPTPTPTPVATQVPTIAPTVKPTNKQTQKSPVPFAGLVIGLGATALFLRLRK